MYVVSCETIKIRIAPNRRKQKLSNMYRSPLIENWTCFNNLRKWLGKKLANWYASPLINCRSLGLKKKTTKWLLCDMRELQNHDDRDVKHRFHNSMLISFKNHTNIIIAILNNSYYYMMLFLQYCVVI